jgi:hypothetical protein
MKLRKDQQSELRTLHESMKLDYPFTKNSIENIQYGFFNGDTILFVGQNPGIQQKDSSADRNQLEYDVLPYEQYVESYENRLRTSKLGKYLFDLYSEDWSDISFTNVFKNPFKDQKVDVLDFSYHYSILEQQIDIIKPRLVVAIGAMARDALRSLQCTEHTIRWCHVYHYMALCYAGRNYDDYCKTEKAFIAKEVEL